MKLRNLYTPIAKALLLAVFAFLATGAAAGAAQGSALAGGPVWLLTEYTANGQTQAVPGNFGISIQFGSDGRAGGSGGCNSYSGPFTENGSSLTFGPIISTKRACINDGRQDWESNYFNALNTVSGFTLSGDQLALTFDGGTLRFVKQANDMPAEAQKEWRLVRFTSAGLTDADASSYGITLTFKPAGELSGQSTCNGYGGNYIVGTGTQLQLSGIIHTLIACAEQDRQDWENRYFAALETVSSYDLSNGQLTLVFDNGLGTMTFALNSTTPGMPTTGESQMPVLPLVLGGLVSLLGVALVTASRKAGQQI